MIFGIVAGALCLMIGLWLILRGLRQYLRCSASRAWPLVTGRVCQAGVGKDWTYAPEKTGTYLYRPYLDYVYTYAGEEYHSAQRKVGEGEKWNRYCTFSNRGEAVAEIAGYFEEKPIEVYCDPMNPGYSILRPGDTSVARATLTLGIILGVIGTVAEVITFLMYSHGWLA